MGQYPILGHCRIVLCLLVASATNGSIDVLRLCIWRKAGAFLGIDNSICVNATTASPRLTRTCIDDVLFFICTIARCVQGMTSNALGRIGGIRPSLWVMLMLDSVKLFTFVKSV